MTTDNRTNEPTEAQVEAAAKAYQAAQNADPYDFKGRMRAALVAAQGAAPQAERDWRLDVVPEPWTAPTPVLPSSGVDEDARSLSAWPTVDEVRETFKKSADRLAFDRMIASVERAAAEKALTEAANELALLDDGGKRGLAGHSKSSASAITHRHAVAVVRARAEAYRQERGEQ